MSTPQNANSSSQGAKQVPAYTESDFRGAVASIDLAAEIILRGRVPKEREQVDLLARSFNSDAMQMKGYRAVLQQAFSKPDSFFEPLLPFIQDAIEAVPVSLSGVKDPYSPMAGVRGAYEEAGQHVREGRLKDLYQTHRDVEGWVRSTVDEVFMTLEQHRFFDSMTGRQLAHATVSLRFVYAQILAGLNEYVVAPERLKQEAVLSFAATAIGDIRAAMMLETFRRFEEDSRLRAAMPEFVALVLGTGEGRIQLSAVSARSQFDVLRNKLRVFQENRGRLSEHLADYCSWGVFLDHGLPHIEELSRGGSEDAALPAPVFFVPGQLAFADIPGDPLEPVIYGAFDTHSGSRCVAAAADPQHSGDEWSFQLSGLGLTEKLTVGARHAGGMRIDGNDKVFPSWSHRLAPVPDGELADKVAGAVRRALGVQEAKLARLWSERPELLEIISEEEPTVVVFDRHGDQVVVLGTCVAKNELREAFFSHGAPASADEWIVRAKLEVEDSKIWLARVLQSAPARKAEPALRELDAEEIRQQDRRAFRDVVQRTGAMSYRAFVASLASWGVVETTEGKGGHGSLKRVEDGCELRAGTWGKLRDPEGHMNFARMYEILDSLRIPVRDYTQRLLGER